MAKHKTQYDNINDIALDMGVGNASRLPLLGLRIQWGPTGAWAASGVSRDIEIIEDGFGKHGNKTVRLVLIKNRDRMGYVRRHS